MQKAVHVRMLQHLALLLVPLFDPAFDLALLASCQLTENISTDRSWKTNLFAIPENPARTALQRRAA